MGKGTDKLYITHSEWASDAAYSASSGSGVGSSNSRSDKASFKRLPFNFCAVSLQPFATPVCNQTGTIYDIDHILPWLAKHGTDPVTGTRLPVDDLIRLKFTKNEQGEYVDPVTFKTFTNNTHLIAIRTSGNVYAYDTVQRLNLKAKVYQDLVSDQTFDGRQDIITLQDPHNLDSRNLSSFKHVKDGVTGPAVLQQKSQSSNVNTKALGNAAALIKTDPPATILPEVGKYLHVQREAPSPAPPVKPIDKSKLRDPNKTSLRSTGQAAASLTSTGLTPHTSTAPAQLTDEEYLLKRGRVTSPGYVLIETSRMGKLTLELHPEHAPKTVWNFLQLCRRGYYDNTIFHRNIRNFMIQGGDPTGTGRGGESCWTHVAAKTTPQKTFADEWPHSRSSHDRRGIVSMANKGRDTNTSQFFILYRAATHLDRKHTIFGQVPLDSSAPGADVNRHTLDRLESDLAVEKSTNRPLDEDAARIVSCQVLVDPFEDYLAAESKREHDTATAAEREGQDQFMTWTGRRVGAAGPGRVADDDIGKYLAPEHAGVRDTGLLEEEWERDAERRNGQVKTHTTVNGGSGPPRKKQKAGRAGGFDNFDAW